MELEYQLYSLNSNAVYFDNKMQRKIDELEVVPHFLPYTGIYDIKCRVWDTLNSISLGIQKSAIEIRLNDISIMAKFGGFG